MRRAALLGVIVLLAVSACGAESPERAEPETVRIVMGGDVMLGRGVNAALQRDPQRIFTGIELELAEADIAMINLESPLTGRPAAAGIQYDLRADPGAAHLLADAGIDLVSVANNHAGDGGREGVLDTISALTHAGVGAVGAGVDAEAASAGSVQTVGDTTVGVLAFDATGVGPRAGESNPGVARWDDASSPLLVARLRERVDVLVVSLHGGSEYLPVADADIARIVAELAELDVDVVWGHGPHVVHEVAVLDPGADGRPTVAASSLGNLVFDQTRIGTDRGALLDVIAGAGGVKALRIGETIVSDGRVTFSSWRSPDGPAVLLDGEWWSLAAEPPHSQPIELDLRDFPKGDVVDVAEGDVDLDGEPDLVVSFRRPFRRAPLNELLRDVQWADAAGRSAHIGVFEMDGRTPRWVASAMVRPVARIAACDGAVAVSYSTLDDDAITAAGGWTWNLFGWDEAADLDGDRSIGCLDVDGDGLRDPVVGSPGRDAT